MEALVKEKGINSFILELFSDSELYEALDHARQLGAHVRILPENRDIINLLEKKMLKMGLSGADGYLQSRPAQVCLIAFVWVGILYEGSSFFESV